MMDKYTKARKISATLNERNDCTVVGVSIAARVDYKKAHAAMKAAGRRDRCGAYRIDTTEAVHALGCAIEVIDAPRQSNGSRFTAKTIGAGFKRGYFLVFYRGHVAAMVNGQVADWTDNRRHQVQEIWKISVPKGSRS
jgi:hypothetical protein